MDVPAGLIAVFIVYGVLYFFDTIFKSCAHYPYVQFLKGTGLELKFLYIKWHTTALNRIIVRWGVNCLRFLNLWFKIGVYASLGLLPVAVLIFAISLSQDLFPSFSDQAPTIEPVIPFVNLPSSEAVYFSISLLVSSLFHELGHALAAVTEDVHINNFGTNVFFILPVAYVTLSTDKLFSLSKPKILKILCAGIWHNLILALVCYLCYICLPFLFSMFFTIGKGVYVTEMGTSSPLSGVRGFSIGDTIVKINDCQITDEESWFYCLQSLQLSTPSFCFDSNLVHELEESVPVKHDQGIVDCCNKNNPKNLCFAYLDTDNGILELPPYACLPARDIIASSTHFCNNPPHNCPPNSYCFRPVLANTTKLIKVERLGANDVIYVGVPSDMSRFLNVSPYVPKYLFTSSVVPDTIRKLFGYTIMISLGLGIINVLPCAYMDGQYIVNTLVPLVFKDGSTDEKAKLVSSIITIFTTLLLFLHLLYVTLKLLI